MYQMLYIINTRHTYPVIIGNVLDNIFTGAIIFLRVFLEFRTSITNHFFKKCKEIKNRLDVILPEGS